MNEPINILEYGYLGDEQITISAREFIVIKRAIESAVENASEEYFPEVSKYIDMSNAEVVLEPSQEDILSGKVQMITDNEATFSGKNLKIKYDAKKMTRETLASLEFIHDIHYRNIESGVAKKREDLEGDKNTEVQGK